MQFRFTYLWVPEVSRAMRFYEEAFGLEVRAAPQDGSWGMMGGTEHGLGFEPPRVAPERGGGRLREGEVGGAPAGFYLVLSVADVDAAWQRARTAGAEPLGAPALVASGNRVAWVRDPNGVVVELCQFPQRREPRSRVRRLLTAAAAGLAVATLGLFLTVLLGIGVGSRLALVAALLLVAGWSACAAAAGVFGGLRAGRQGSDVGRLVALCGAGLLATLALAFRLGAV